MLNITLKPICDVPVKVNFIPVMFFSVSSVDVVLCCLYNAKPNAQI